MENTIGGAARGTVGEQSAVRNVGSGASMLKLVVLWLAVSIPLLWGVMKALQEPGNLLP
ncbi:MAG TPA: hypothetical protein VHS76_04780 [Steroidobacteraceae bacterium]|nr:hypothetical protein [Steroidobacteraceae bacterium]